MSAPVDVLAVMRRAGFHCEGLGSIAQDIIDARAAVAELIAANHAEYAAQAAYEKAVTGTARNEAWAALLLARERRVIALSRVGGAA